MGTDTYTVSGSVTAFRHRTPHVLGGPVDEIQIGFMNWRYYYDQEISNPNDTTIEYAWLERESTGQIVPLTFDSNRQFVMPADATNSYFATDVVDSSVWTNGAPAQDEVFWVNVIGSLPTNGAVCLGSPATWTDAKFVVYDATNTAYQAHNVADTNGALPYVSGQITRSAGLPLVFMGRFSEPGHLSVIGTGDSILYGSGDIVSVLPAISGFGYFDRCAVDESGENAIAVFNMARHGATSKIWGSSVHMPGLLKLANVLVEEFGTNDIGSNGTGDTAALTARLEGLWSLARTNNIQYILRTLLLPRTSSTNSWTTFEGQTPNTGWDDGGKRDIMNSYFQSALSNGTIDVVVNTLDPVADPSDNHYWLTDGTAQYVTTDGTHVSPTGNGILAATLRTELLALIDAPPAAPASLTAIGLTNRIDLAWTAANGADSYIVKRGITNGVYSAVASNITATSYSDTGLDAATTYYYVVSAVNTNGESINSSEASATTFDPSAPPEAPADLIATVAATNQIDLSWSAAANADSYIVQRGTTSGVYTAIASNVTETSYSDIGLDAATTYYYVVSAVNANGEGADSDETSATTGGGAPVIDTNHIVYSDDFESYATNSSYSVTTTYTKFDRSAIYNDTFNNGVVNPFGSSNQYASSINGGGMIRYTTVSLSAGTGLSTYAFDFYDPSAFVSSASKSAIYFGLGTSDVSSTGYTTWGYKDGILSLFGNTEQVSGSLPTLSEDHVYTVYVLYNASGASQTIGGTSTVLADGNVALYIYDHTASTLIDGGLYSSANTTAPTAMYINRNYSTGDGIYYIDNFVQTDDLVAMATGTPAPTIPAAPTGLEATASITNQIDLSWTLSVGADSYSVKRGITSGSYTTIASNVALTSYSDTGLSSTTTYYYVVSAVNTNGESADSTEASATTIDPHPLPAVPEGLTAAALLANRIDLSWAAAAEADSYTVKRGTASGSYTTVISNVTETSYSDTGLDSATTYYYVISAVNANGESANSEEAIATTIDPDPPTISTPGIDTNHIVYSDNFESYPTSSLTTFWPDSAKLDKVAIYDDTFNDGVVNPFGSSNQYAASTSGTSLRYTTISKSTTGLSTYAFDFYDPSAFTTASGSAAMYFGLGAADIGSRGYVSWGYKNGTLSLDTYTVAVRGSLPTLSEDHIYTIYVLYNASGSSQTIGETSAILADGNVALYIYDHTTSSLIDAGQYSSSNTSYPTPDSFLLDRNFSSGSGIYYVDNFAQTDELLMIEASNSMPTPTPAALSFSYNNGEITISSDNLTEGSTHTLQMKTNLTDAVWSDIVTTSGVSSANWIITPEGDHVFFRILSE